MQAWLTPIPFTPAPQTYVDPDEIFQQHQKTCSLDEVFANGEGRGSSSSSHRMLGSRKLGGPSACLQLCLP